MTNPLLRPFKPDEGADADRRDRSSVDLTMADIDALQMLSRGACTAADKTYGDSAIDRHVLRKLVDHRLASFISSPSTTIDRAQITALGRDVLRQMQSL